MSDATFPKEFPASAWQDLFDFLELHWMASQKVLDEAMARFDRLFGPERTAALSPELRRMAEQVLAEAHRIAAMLGTPDSRREYRMSFLEPFAVDQAITLPLDALEGLGHRQRERGLLRHPHHRLQVALVEHPAVRWFSR